MGTIYSQTELAPPLVVCNLSLMLLEASFQQQKFVYIWGLPPPLWSAQIYVKAGTEQS